MADDKRESEAKSDGRQPAASVLNWIRGEELPPFEPGNAAAVELAVALARGRASLDSPVLISNGLALQLYQLLCESATRPASCRGLVFKDYLRALSSLHFGCSEPRLLGRMQVRHAVLRDDRGMRGLLPKLRECLRARESTPALQNMTREQARAHLLKQWDLEPMDLAAAGGGGGDPGGSGGGATQEQPAQPKGLPRLDIRTRSFADQVVLCASARRVLLHSRVCLQPRLTMWHHGLGYFPTDVLRLIDDFVRGTPHARARKEETHELQAVALRKAVDSQKAAVAEAEAQARRHEVAATRSLRALDAARDEHQQQLREAAELHEEHRKSFQAQLKVQRSAAAAAQRALKVELQDERLAAQQEITDLQAIITRQDRALNSAHAALRSSVKQTESEMGKLQAEMQKVSVGFEWDNTADYNLDAIVGTVVTDGNSEYANQVRSPARPHHARSLTPSRLLAGQDAEGRDALPLCVGGLSAGRALVRDRGERRWHHRLRAVLGDTCQRRERGGG